MVTLTSVEAQSRFGELIDRSQREPVQLTRLEAASRRYAQYREQLARGQGVSAEAAALSDADVTQLVHELR